MYGNLICAALVLFIAAGTWLHGYHHGEVQAISEYRQRDLQTATEAGIAYAGIVSRYRAQEAKWQKSFSSVSTQQQKDRLANEKALDIALASGRLYDRNASNPQACGGGATTVAASPSGGDAGKGSFLSESASGFLRRLANEADSVVIQLQACQAILKAERQ